MIMQSRFGRALCVCWLVVVGAFLTTGCDATTIFAPGPTPEPLSVSTTAQLGASENIEVELAGDSTGHRAGQTSRFTYGLRNLAQQIWKGEYCILLTDSQKTVLEVQHQTVDLASGEHIGGELQVALPSNMAAGMHNLDILVPGEGHQGIPIAVGQFLLPGLPSVNVPTACPK